MRHAGDRSRSWFRVGAFAPFLISIVVILVALGWLLHKSRARAAKITFDVEVEGLPRIDYSATLNGANYRSGEPSGLGKKVLEVSVKDAEPFRTNLNVGYSGVELGTLSLPGSQGTLALEVAPHRNTVVVSGANIRRVFSKCSNEVLNLPIGQYEVVSQFEHFELTERVVVRRNARVTLKILPATTTLTINSDPPGSDFELSRRAIRIKVVGKTPAIVNDLPVDAFDLEIWRGSFRKNAQVNLTRKDTNDVSVTFDYARVDFTSKPEGAEVRMRDEVLGRTPFSRSFAPGSYEVRIERDGFFPKDMQFILKEGAKEDLSVDLENIAFAKAFQNANSALQRFDPDYELALREIDSALAITATDDAKKLRGEILFRRQFAEARNFARSNDLEQALAAVNRALQMQDSNSAAIELRDEITGALQKRASLAAKERQRLPSQIFAKEVSGIKYHEYFETKSIRVQGDASKVHSDVLRALAKKPVWRISRAPNISDGLYLIDAEAKGLLSKERALILIDQQPGASDCTVYFRLVNYVLGDKIEIKSFTSGVSDESWQPLHRNFRSGSPDIVEAQRNRNIELFRQKLASELKPL